MQYRNFRGAAIAEVGLGTWQLGSADWGSIDKQDALTILQAYTAAGGNFINTADVYGMGVSEKVIGEFLQTIPAPKEIFVATKLGRRHDAPNGWPQNFSYDHMKRHTEESLQHLGLSQLFLQQLHCIPTEEMRSGKVFDHLRRLRADGLVRHFGASVETTEEALICLEQEGLASLQIIFNLFRQHVAEELFEKAQKKGVALIVRVPLASGLLSGKYTKDTHFAPADHRHFNANGEAFNAGETFSGVPFEQGVDFAAAISRQLPDTDMAKWAIRWILDYPAVTTVIPGASKISQVDVNVAASAAPPLSPEVHQQLKQLYRERIQGTIRGHY